MINGEPPTDDVRPDDAELRELVDQYGGQLYSLGLRFCGDTHDAEDLVQEVFLSAYRAWDSFEGRSSRKTWLYTIATRACQRMHRLRAGEPKQIGSLDELLPFGESRIAALVADQDAPAQVHIRREARERAERAIASLPDDHRVPLILKDVVELSITEIGEILGLPEGTVKSRVHRARLRVRADVDGALPRDSHEAPPPAYPVQVCLDLLNAKQEALDRGVPFDREIICERCLSVFASLDLAQDACRELVERDLPTQLRQRLLAALKTA
ncbi:MAG: RNA polymerase sigma factor [Phycisphaerae bacterium]